MVSMGMTVESSAEAVRLAQSYEGVLAAIGIHPWNAVPPTDEIRRHLAELARQEQVVAIGEIGLALSLMLVQSSYEFLPSRVGLFQGYAEPLAGVDF